MNGINLQLVSTVLESTIKPVVAETIAQLDADRTKLGDKLCFR